MKNKLIALLVIVFFALNICSAMDTYPNIIKGTVFLDKNHPAPAGTEITLVVISGEYKDFIKTTTVDSQDIPPFLYKRGFYIFEDDLHYDTGELYKLVVDNGTHD